MPTRQFTRAELDALGVPPADPSDVRYSETLLSDTHVTTLKYSQQRRVVFRADDDGKTYAVTYEAEVDSGDYEGGPPPENYGWFGGTVEAAEVEQRPVVIQQWVTVSDEPGLHGPRQSLLDELTDMFEEGGVRTSIARQSAAEWMTDHADDMAALSRARHFLEAAAAVTALQNQMDAEIRAEYGGELDRDTEVESTATRRMAAMLRERSEQPAPADAATTTGLVDAVTSAIHDFDNEAWKSTKDQVNDLRYALADHHEQAAVPVRPMSTHIGAAALRSAGYQAREGCGTGPLPQDVRDQVASWLACLANAADARARSVEDQATRP